MCTVGLFFGYLPNANAAPSIAANISAYTPNEIYTNLFVSGVPSSFAKSRTGKTTNTTNTIAIVIAATTIPPVTIFLLFNGGESVVLDSPVQFCFYKNMFKRLSNNKKPAGDFPADHLIC